MKKSFLALALLLGVSAAAVTQANESSHTSFTYSGQSEETVALTSMKYRTEYRDVPVQKTCYRQVFVGYRQVCRPRPGGGQICNQVPVYRNVPYSCTVIERRAFRVEDAYVNAQVTLRFSDFPAEFLPNETFSVSLSEDSVSVATSSSKVLVVLGNGANSANRIEMGAIDQINMTSEKPVSFFVAEPFVKAFEAGIEEISVINGKISFKASAAMTDLNLPLYLNVTRKRALASDYGVYDRVLPITAFAKTVQNDGTAVYKATYAQLGIPELGEGKFLFTFGTSIDRAMAGLGKVINKSTINGDLSTSSQMLLKIK